jgi:hypothetical protein
MTMARSQEKRVDQELTLLLKSARSAEHPDLEFKLELHFESVAEKAELAKDVALQANLPSGGSIVYGVTNEGQPEGLSIVPEKNRIENVLANRLMFPPSSIDVIETQLLSTKGSAVPVIWIRVGPNPQGPITCFLGSDSSWKLPRRVGTVTRYLSPAEAIVVSRPAQLEGSQVQRGMPTYAIGDAPDILSESLESNLFPFAALPHTVWSGPTTSASSLEVAREIGGLCPPVAVQDGQLYSLRSDAECSRVFSAFLTASAGPVPTMRILRRHGSRAMFIGLLNQELVDFCLRRGLGFDADKKRIYFHTDEGKATTVAWRAYKNRTTRVVAAPRLTKEGATIYWYHLATRLDVVDLEDSFALAINPTWVFSKDGTTLLEGVAVGPIAGRRMAFEDNARVRYNVRFWIRFLSNEAERLQLPLRSGGATIVANSSHVTLPVGIASDRQAVVELGGGSDEEIPEPIPVESEDSRDEEEGDSSETPS